jgi:hypothetical protein
MTTPKVVTMNPLPEGAAEGALHLEPGHIVGFDANDPAATERALAALDAAAAQDTAARQATNRRHIEEMGMHPGPDLKTRI